jgi:hypothetical protein
MTTDATLKLFRSLTGETAIGYKRADLPIVHVIAQAEPGTRFTVDDHFASCEICKAHGVTQERFHAWYTEKLS